MARGCSKARPIYFNSMRYEFVVSGLLIEMVIKLNLAGFWLDPIWMGQIRGDFFNTRADSGFEKKTQFEFVQN